MSRAAMQQALEALELGRDYAEGERLENERRYKGHEHLAPDDAYAVGQIDAAIAALRAALAEQAQPVAWKHRDHREILDADPREWGRADEPWIPLYTTPPAPIVPPGWKLVPVEPTEAMLSAAQSAWLRDPARKTTTMYRAMLAAAPEAPSPPAPQPLADDDIDAITHAQWGTRLPGVMVAAHREYARAVEAEALRRMGVQQ